MVCFSFTGTVCPSIYIRFANIRNLTNVSQPLLCGGTVFTAVCLFVCLSVSRITKTLRAGFHDFHEIYGLGRLLSKIRRFSLGLFSAYVVRLVLGTHVSVKVILVK